jgi:hypothetical protein
MKVLVVVEGPSDVAVLKVLLPNDILGTCDFVPAGGRSALSSIARTLLVKHRRPLALMFDTETLEASAIREAFSTMDQLLRAVAVKTPVVIIPCIPELEAIFFEAPATLKRLFPQYDQQFFLMFAKTRPKEALTILFENGGGPTTLPELLDCLTSDDVEQFRRIYPITQLITFISDVCQMVPTS